MDSVAGAAAAAAAATNAASVISTAELQQHYHNQFGTGVLPLLLSHRHQEDQLLNPTTASAFHFRHQHEAEDIIAGQTNNVPAASAISSAISVNSIYNTLSSLSSAMNHQQHAFVDANDAGSYGVINSGSAKYNNANHFPLPSVETVYFDQHQQAQVIQPSSATLDVNNGCQNVADVEHVGSGKHVHGEQRQQETQFQHPLRDEQEPAVAYTASRASNSTNTSNESSDRNQHKPRRNRTPLVECIGSRNNCWLIKHYEVDREIADAETSCNSKSLAARAVELHFRQALESTSGQAKARPMNQRRLPASFFIKPTSSHQVVVDAAATAAATATAAAAAAAAAALQRTLGTQNTGSYMQQHQHHNHHQQQHYPSHQQAQSQQSANIFSHQAAAAAAAAAALEAAHYNTPTPYNNYYYSSMASHHQNSTHQQHHQQQQATAAAVYAAQQAGALNNFMSASSSTTTPAAADFAASFGGNVASGQYGAAVAPAQQHQQQAAAVADAYSAYGHAFACNSSFYNTQAAALAAAHASYQQHQHRNGIPADPWTMYASAYSAVTPAISAVPPTTLPTVQQQHQHAFGAGRQSSHSYN